MNKWKEDFQNKLISPQNLEIEIKDLKHKGYSIATLNGSFDILHAGHLQMIYEASQLADRLIVALNTDASIQRYKSKNRPIIPLEYRLQMVAALQFVDHITWFDEDNPINLLQIIKPDIHINGVEYGENCIESKVVVENGGKIHLVNLLDELSTSKIIERIVNCV